MFFDDDDNIEKQENTSVRSVFLKLNDLFLSALLPRAIFHGMAYTKQ